ncbi:uncharacterized protein PODANS_3_8060 [Podospora anserina S mat+]|uniref:U6 snRNA-associated Sm-like protein LSm1 n=1 Tax=Podospora anserina (strain S / ATCC MYA-4624 / DSM 980 / FGSC 10383) TaxID=515849 RepID=B2B119_PODAN|nr:uncharacterized protein PODANS_3_8060 [Podospora anserina S mat+]CAP70744.1 unnamed protein product [Podospora anserina S mat+]CDP27336.1 Putative Sm-like protein LSm1 [Podospora anserina S mat+]
MEHLSIHDHQHGPPPPGMMPQPPQHPGGPVPQGMMPPGLGRPPQPQQLPAQMFTTAAQLLDLTDKKLMISLRDGRKLIGILRSWDQFANLVLQSTKERIFVPPVLSEKEPTGIFADIDRGTFLVRGENVLLLGEIDLDKDDDAPPGYQLADIKMVEKLARERKKEEKVKEKKKTKMLGKEGFEGENLGEMPLI